MSNPLPTITRSLFVRTGDYGRGQYLTVEVRARPLTPGHGWDDDMTGDQLELAASHLWRIVSETRIEDQMDGGGISNTRTDVDWEDVVAHEPTDAEITAICEEEFGNLLERQRDIAEEVAEQAAEDPEFAASGRGRRFDIEVAA